MAIPVSPSIRPVLLGSMVLLMSAACQRAERSDDVDTTAAPQDTTGSQTPSAPAPSQYPLSLERERQDQERIERVPVAGKDDEKIAEDDEMELGAGGKGGTGGTGGSGGSGGSK